VDNDRRVKVTYWRHNPAPEAYLVEVEYWTGDRLMHTNVFNSVMYTMPDVEAWLRGEDDWFIRG